MKYRKSAVKYLALDEPEPPLYQIADCPNLYGDGHPPASKWSGAKYVGEYRNGDRRGQGTYTSGDGTWIKKGLWNNGEFLGETTYR